MKIDSFKKFKQSNSMKDRLEIYPPFLQDVAILFPIFVKWKTDHHIVREVWNFQDEFLHK